MMESKDLMVFDLFAGLREEDLTDIALLCHRHSYEKDTIIFAAGGSSADIYLLESGSVVIEIDPVDSNHKTKTVICTVYKGETFGWSALVPPHLFTASARSIEKADVITINGADLLTLLKRHNFIGNTIMRNLSAVISSRLTCTTTALRDQILNRPKNS